MRFPGRVFRIHRQSRLAGYFPGAPGELIDAWETRLIVDPQTAPNKMPVKINADD